MKYANKSFFTLYLQKNNTQFSQATIIIHVVSCPQHSISKYIILFTNYRGLTCGHELNRQNRKLKDLRLVFLFGLLSIRFQKLCFTHKGLILTSSEMIYPNSGRAVGSLCQHCSINLEYVSFFVCSRNHLSLSLSLDSAYTFKVMVLLACRKPYIL